MASRIPYSTRCGSFRDLVAVVALALITLLTLVLTSSTSAGAAQASGYELVAFVDEVSGDSVTITVRLIPGSAALGALEGSLVFDPGVVTPTGCELVGDLGACNPLDDRMRFSALFIDGLDEPATLMTVTFATLETNVEATLAFADIAGFDTSTAPISTSTSPITFTTGSGSSNPLFIALPVIAVVAAAVGLLAARKRTR